MTWDQESEGRLLEMVNEGKLSCREIGKILHVTRNAIIGKLHRMGYKRDAQVKSKLMARPREARVIKKTIAPAPIVLSPEPQPVKYTTARKAVEALEKDSCRWPIGDPMGDFAFCMQQKVDGLPYCKDHLKKAYVPRHR
jgi:GcrA cell cycle regulator